MDQMTYSNVLGAIKKSSCFPHSRFPGHNLLSIDTMLKHTQNFNEVDDSFNEIFNDSNKFLSTFPCYKPFDYTVETNTVLHCGYGLEDDAANLVKEKLKWEKKLKSIRISNIDNAVKCIKQLREDKSVRLSENLTNYINHFHNDPEPNFHGHYNWLYTNGNLISVNVNNRVILFSSDYKNEQRCLSMLELNKSFDDIEFESSSFLKSKSPVLQINSKSTNNITIICVRQNNNSSIFKLNDRESIYFPVKLWRKKVSNKKLLTCVDVNDNCEEVAITDSKFDMHIFNIETKAKVFGYTNRKSKLRDSWCHISFSNKSIYLTDRNSFKIIDAREVNSKPVIKYEPLGIINDCEDICSVEKSICDSNYLYLGTTHNLIQIDIREGKAIQRWTHMLKDPPQFLSCLKEGGNDFLMMQSQLVNECLGVTNEYLFNENDDESFISKSLPCLLTNVKESLRLAKLNGICLNPFISKRLDYAVTGFHSLQNNGEILLYKTNSGGDIFLSKIKKKSEVDEIEDKRKCTILESMKTYECHFEKYLKTKMASLPGGEPNNLSYVLKELKKPSVKKIYTKPEMLWRYHEMYSPYNLKHHKDFLAKKILKVWGVNADDDDDDDDDEEKYDSTMSANSKVEEWIKNL